ncbi:MAG: aminotransferase class I/II-fold pyridoxal phosphate-dependent enzyme [Acidobacteriota bacterium]
MELSRRSFVRALSVAGAGLVSPQAITARGREAGFAAGWLGQGDSASTILLNSNENPLGPGPAALDALKAALGDACRYPSRAGDRLPNAIAAALQVPADHVLPACGSGEILTIAVEAFCSPTRPLVTGLPTFETCTRTATFRNLPVHEVRVAADMALDLRGMEDKAAGAGLIFLCNPNNPTGTVFGAPVIEGFIDRVRRVSPDTIILVDEAYHEYVGEPSYASAIPLAREYPQVIVSRTCSKVHGMAGLRVGFAIGRPETLRKMSGWRLGNGLNILGIHAAAAALGDAANIARARAANREARDFARQLFGDLGYRVLESHTNFVLVDIRRDAAEFAKACRAGGVSVGRPFPPLTTWSRISLGTMAEMERAAATFRKILRG